MNLIKKNKIQLECYFSGDMSYEKHNSNTYILTTPLKFIPYDLKFDELEIKKIIELLLKGDTHLKITIEKENRK